MKILFTPFRLVSGILAGLLAAKLFEKLWSSFDDQEPPDAEHREISWPKMILALALEGAIFRLVRGIADHGARAGFARLTGRWPGEEAPEPE